MKNGILTISSILFTIHLLRELYFLILQRLALSPTASKSVFTSSKQRSSRQYIRLNYFALYRLSLEVGCQVPCPSTVETQTNAISSKQSLNSNLPRCSPYPFPHYSKFLNRLPDRTAFPMPLVDDPSSDLRRQAQERRGLLLRRVPVRGSPRCSTSIRHGPVDFAARKAGQIRS